MKQKNNLIFWVIVILILILLGWGASKLASNDPRPQNSDILKIQSLDWVKGDPQAKLLLIEYSDFQCPACKTAAFYMQQLEADSSNLNKDVAIVFRHFPLNKIHAQAQLAAQAAEAAGKQNKFWEMHNILFDQQSIWSTSDNAEESFINYAKDLGLDLEKFKNDLYAEDVKNKVANNIKEGGADQLNISYTPTVYLNGEIIDLPNSYDKFRQLLQGELNK